MLRLTKKSANLDLGKAAENLAQQFLLDQGLQPVCRNYRCKHGELDLVMNDGKTLVFVEVRYRKNDSHGGALASVTTVKQAKIIAAAQHYLLSRSTGCPLRFDVIALSGNGHIQWIKNAFDC